METLRRWILLAAVSAALMAAFYASLRPFLTVEPVDMAAEQKDESRLTERGQYLSQLLLDEYVAEVTAGQSVQVSGTDWEALLAGVRRAATENPLPGEWKSRVSRQEYDQAYYPRQVHFLAAEPPFAALGHGLTRTGQQAYLVLKAAAGASYFTLTYHAFSHDDFSFGSGLSHSPTPPDRIFRPFKRYAPWPLLAGLAAYILMPWPKRRKNALQYRRWRIVLGDFASFLLFVPFFAIPMLVLGGAVQGLTQGWILAAVFWPLAFAGVWLLFRNGRYAEYCLVWTEAGLTMGLGRKSRTIPFDGLKFYQPLVLKPPKWLVIVSWLAALAGRGSARMGAAGRALILGSSAYGGLGLGLKDGSSVFVWVTDALGGDTTGGAGRLVKALDKAGIHRRDEVKTLSGITEPDGETADGKRIRSKSDRILIFLFLTPLVVMVVGLLLLSLPGGFNRAISSTSSGPGGRTEAAEDVSFTASEPALPAAWSAAVALGDITAAEAAIPASGGGYLVAGRCSGEGGGTDGFLARIDAGGQKLWQAKYGDAGRVSFSALAEASDGGVFAAGEAGPQMAFEGRLRVFLVKADASGKAEWEKTLGAEDAAHEVFTVRAVDGGGCEVLGLAGSRLFSWTVDAAGAVAGTRDVDLGETRELTVAHAVWMPDGGFAAAGEVVNPGAGFKDLWLARFDAGGRRLWSRDFGGRKKDGAAFVSVLPDGGLAAAGLTESSGAGLSDAYLVRVDAEGELVWENAFGTPGEERAVHVAVAPDGGFLLTGAVRAAADKPSRFYVLRLGPDGSPSASFVFGGGARFEPACGIPESDGDVIAGSATAGEFFQTTAGLVKIRK